MLPRGVTVQFSTLIFKVDISWYRPKSEITFFNSFRAQKHEKARSFLVMKTADYHFLNQKITSSRDSII